MSQVRTVPQGISHFAVVNAVNAVAMGTSSVPDMVTKIKDATGPCDAHPLMRCKDCAVHNTLTRLAPRTKDQIKKGHIPCGQSRFL